MSATLYIFIRNTGAVKYKVAFKEASAANYDVNNVFIIDAMPGTWTTDDTHTLPDENKDYNIKIIPICANTQQGSPFFIYVQGSCRGVEVEGGWNNCNCPEITDIGIIV